MQLARTCLSFAALAAVCAPAHATETVSCVGTGDPGVTVEMNLGSGLPADRPNWVRVTTPDGAWSTLSVDEATPVALYQSFDDGRSFSIDLADATVESLAILIRLLRGEEGDHTVRIGYLRVVGQSIHPIVCDFGESE